MVLELSGLALRTAMSVKGMVTPGGRVVAGLAELSGASCPGRPCCPVCYPVACPVVNVRKRTIPDKCLGYFFDFASVFGLRGGG